MEANTVIIETGIQHPQTTIGNIVLGRYTEKVTEDYSAKHTHYIMKKE